MTPTPHGASPRLVESLARVARKHKIARKLVVAPNYAAGRELLRRLSLDGGGWIGFEVTTPHRLAHRLAQTELERTGLSVLDAFAQQALLDEALDSALVAEQGVFGALSEGIGFREAVHGALNALRIGGVGPRDLDAARFAQWQKKLFLLRVLQRYEALLSNRRRADSAAIVRLALEALESEGSRLPATLDADVVLLVPGLPVRGLNGRFVSALAARGAKVLESDPVIGLEVPESVLSGRNGDPSPASHLYSPDSIPGDVEPPDIDLFRASSVDAELREVLRRISDRGLKWDQVEIITPDPVAYGSAMHALATRLQIPVTYAVGLPIARTRTGRVVHTYLDWIEEGFQASPIRRLLEAGDLRPPRAKGNHAPASLARRFRTLRVGWGRKRYRAQLREALAGVDLLTARKTDSSEAFERRRERLRSELEALKAILFPALQATPAVPDRMGKGGESVSAAELARGLRAFLRRVPRGRGPDRSAREEVSRILERVEATLTRRTDFRSAVATLRRHLQIRVRPELSGDDPDGVGAPWSSAGGALHLTDLEHGGFTGRGTVFMVGLSSDQLPGFGGQDPVLLDSDRRVLGDSLPTSVELLREQLFRFAALFARLRGAVTMSYGAWQATDARVVGPSSALLQALRLSRSDHTLTFQDLHETLGRVVGAIPRAGRSSIDSDDVWMGALAAGDVIRAGRAAVRGAFSPIDRGLVAQGARLDGTPGPVHGVINPRPDELDPRRNEATVVSASRLESLGTCPLRYLLSSVLRAYPPDDHEIDPDAWLDHRERGSLLHSVYDGTLRETRARGLRADDPAFEELGLDQLSRGIQRLRAEVPIPGEGTLARETARLREDVLSFVRMIRQQNPECVALELKFGLGDDEPVELKLEKGRLKLRGAIDRVDADLAGFHVVDYKTGAAYGYEGDAFNGGRRLQHALYAHVAEERLGGEVVDGQYHFPTRRGQNQSFVYDRSTLAGVDKLIDLMMDGVAAGHFVPTDEPDDCTFCDYAEVCRVRRTSFKGTVSPMAEWSREVANAGVWPAFEQLRRVRTYEE